MKRFLNPSKKANIKTLFKTTHLSVFTSTKDKVPPLSKSQRKSVYEVKCPGCGIQYIGKTDRTLHERTREHAWSDVDCPLRNHLSSCEHFLRTYGLLSIPDYNTSDDIFGHGIISLRVFSIELVRQNSRILHTDRNWNRLLYKESLSIERLNPVLNRGLKAK